jgi:preprotein translocase subunit SecA
MDRLGVGEEDMIENRIVSGSIAQAQSRIEGHNFDMRKYVLEYDDVMNKHRETMYRLRRQVLSSEDNKERVVGYIKDQVNGIVHAHVDPVTGEMDREEIYEALRAMAPFTESLRQELTDMPESPEAVSEAIQEKIVLLYDDHERNIGSAQLRQIEKVVTLSIVDSVWVDHIDAMEHLRDSVRLRAYGQHDPLVEYKIEAQRMFAGLLSTVASRVADIVFKVSLTPQTAPLQMQESRPDISGDEVTARLDSRDNSSADLTVHADNIGRNDPCPCGSGKKYKKCGLLNTEEHQRLMSRK